MKILIMVLSFIALILAGFNVTKLNFDALFQGESMIALITILASLCAILLLQILRISKRVEALSKKR
jgi:hypothetical protein